MEENIEQQGMQTPEPKKRGSFEKGLAVGIFSTLIVMMILIFAIGVAVFGKSFFSLRKNDVKDSQLIVEKLEDGEEADESLLNAEMLGELASIQSYLDTDFLYEVDKEKLRKGMLEGMVAALEDPYSEYYDAEELASFLDSTEGEYVGIGAAVTQEISTGIVRISRPYEGTPSAEAGLLPGDIIVSVDEVEVTGMDLNQVVSLIKGEEGTKVILHILRESEEAYKDIEVTRRKVEIPTVISKMLDGNVGYIEVTGFDGVTAPQFIEAYEKLQKEGMESVIVDLRDNGGGLVSTVEEMLDYLLPEGVIFYAKDKAGTKSMEYSSDAKAALDIPIVVLVNKNTASASEIFAGNIQEFKVGKVVGTTTYGKGVMQQMFYLNNQDDAAIKLTVADYYIHSDKNIHGKGITPDVEIELDESVANQLEIPPEQDNQLQKAIEVVNGLK